MTSLDPTLGRFALLERVGEGAHGTVYRAQELATGREVALKLGPPGAHDPAAELRFKQEFRAMTRLDHLHLAAVHDFGLLPDGRPYFSIAWVPGPDLAALAPLAPARLLELLPKLARTLAYLHDLGYVHADFKPSNVRLQPDGTPILLDPGLLLRAGEAAARPTGALAYMAPEALRGDRLDARADLYALGATCYHLLTGHPPFAGDDIPTLVKAQLAGKPAPLATFDPALDQLLSRMLAPEPAARPRSVAEVLEALGLSAGEEGPPRPLAAAFVGRRAELAAFEAGLASLRAGQGGTLAFAGASGTGKTRLLAECRVLARLEDVPCFTLPCQEVGTPYGPFVRLLRARLPWVRTACGEHRAAVGRLLPELAEAGDPPPLEPREERVVLQAALAHLLGALAGGTGAVLAFDDWDRVDASSAEAVAYLGRNAQVLVLKTAREAGYLGAHAAVLAPLARAEVAALAGGLLGAARLPAAFTTALARVTGGHVGHVERGVAHLLQTGVLARERGAWRVPATVSAEDLGAGFQALVLAPLEALTEPAARLAELTAIAHEHADLGTLLALARLDEASLFAALDELRARQIVEVHEGRVRFASGGLEEAVYARMPERSRLWFHAAAAARLEASLDAAGPPDAGARLALARHYVRSRQTAKALPAVLWAVDLAVAVFAIDAARTLLRDGLALLNPADERHTAWRRDGLTRLAALERWRGDLDAMSACLAEALPLAEALADPAPLARLLVHQAAYHNQRMTPKDHHAAKALLSRVAGLDGAEPDVCTRAAFMRGQAHFYLGEAMLGREAFEAAAALAQTHGLPFWRAKSLAFLGHLQATGEPAGRGPGFVRLEEAATLQAGLGDRYGRCFTLALQVDALLGALRLPEAEVAVLAQIELGSELGAGEDVVVGLANLAMIRVLAGRYRQALVDGERASALASGHPVGVLVEAMVGHALVQTGELGRAARALEAASTGGGGYMAAHALPFLLESWLRLGRLERVATLVDEATRHCGAHPDAALEAQLHALAGTGRLAAGDLAAARTHSEAASRHAATCDLPLPRHRALLLAARLADREGRAGPARELAEEALAIAEAGGAAGLSAEASRLLGELTAAPAHFHALHAHADREGVPLWRAQALAGESAAEPSPERAETLWLEARQILLSLGDALPGLERQAFLDGPACAAVLARRPEPASDELLAARRHIAALESVLKLLTTALAAGAP